MFPVNVCDVYRNNYYPTASVAQKIIFQTFWFLLTIILVVLEKGLNILIKIFTEIEKNV